MSMRENDLLHHIYQNNKMLDETITVPPGDDMAAILIGNQTLLIGVDQVIDGVHINLSQDNTIEDAAHKLILRNLSDVAAMGALPVAATVTAALPSDMSQKQAEALSDIIRIKAGEYHCPIIGGDTSVHNGPLHLTMNVLARPICQNKPITRSGANIGDFIYVTGELGGAWQPNGTGRHVSQKPAIACIEALIQAGCTPSAMMDISDGLAADLNRLCRQSQCGSKVHIMQLPLGLGITEDKYPGWRHALNDGEDYELLMVFPQDIAEKLPASVGGRKLTQIGIILDGEPRIELEDIGQVFEVVKKGGWEHQSNE